MKHKNDYRIHKNFKGYAPYVYFIKHNPSGLWYIGSKFSKNANPETFLIEYFTSSDIVHEIMEISPKEDFSYKILKTFTNSSDALDYERRLLIKTHAVEDVTSMNRDNKQTPENVIQNKYPTRMISNPLTKKCIRVKKDSVLPEGFIEGNMNAGNPKSKGRRWFYDPETNIPYHIDKDAEPDPLWVRGRGPEYKTNSETVKLKKLKYITDGVNTILIGPGEEIPEGYRYGRTKSIKERTNGNISNAARKGLKYYTNGIETKQFKPEDVPKNWRLGHSKIFGSKGKIKINNGIVELYVDPSLPIPEGFVIGCKPKNKRTKPMPKKFVYTNGVERLYINEGDCVPDCFYPIAEYRKMTKVCLFPKAPKISITNGIEQRFIPFHHEIPEGWNKGHLYKQKRTRFVELTVPETGEKVLIHPSETHLYPNYIRKQRFQKGGVAPNKGRVSYISPDGKTKLLKPTDKVPDGYIKGTTIDRRKNKIS